MGGRGYGGEGRGRLYTYRYTVTTTENDVCVKVGSDESHLMFHNRRFPEITSEDNLTVFSYSGGVKSPEWRWQRRRADLRQFEIFRHGPIIIYTRLPAGGTYYPICTFPASSECLIGISKAFSAFCLRVSVIFLTCSLYPQQKRAYSALHPQARTCTYRSMPGGSYRVQSPGFPKIVYCEGQSHKTTTFEEKGAPKQIRTEVPLLTSLSLPLDQTGLLLLFFFFFLMMMVEALLYIHRNRGLIREGSPECPPHFHRAPKLSSF